MSKAVTMDELDHIVKELFLPLVPDVADIEVDAFISALRTSIGFSVLRLAKANRASITELEGKNVFEVGDVTFNSLVFDLENSCGLGENNIGIVLEKLQEVLGGMIAEEKELQLSYFGIYMSGPPSVLLKLDDDLRLIVSNWDGK